MGQPWTPERVRELRTRLGLTQAALAGRIGCKRLTIQHWEHGRRNPQGLAVAALDSLEEDMDLQAKISATDTAACRRKLAEALEGSIRAERAHEGKPLTGNVHTTVTAEAVYAATVDHRRTLETIAVALDGDERTVEAAYALSQLDPDPLTDPFDMLHPVPDSNDAKRLAILESLG